MIDEPSSRASVGPAEPDTVRDARSGAFDDVEQARVLAAVQSQLFDPSAALRLSRYVLLQKIGQGAMGVVYRAFDPLLERQVAIKAIQISARDGDGTARFTREAKALAKFVHPNVVAVHDVGSFRLGDHAGVEGLNPTGRVDGQGAFIVMELVDGEDLSRWLESAPRKPAEILETLAKAGEGLAALHDAGLVHRDFKLSNVLLSRSGRVCVADFGLAGAIDAELPPTPSPDPLAEDDGEVSDWTRLTGTGVALGTPVYMAPEQHRGLAITARSDQYAFCTALYRALSGTFPYEGETVAQLLRDKTEQYPPPLIETKGVPIRIFRAIVRGLHPDPRQRHESMRTLLSALGLRGPRWGRRLALWLAWPAAAAAGVAAIMPMLEPGMLQLQVQDGDQAITAFTIRVDDEPTQVTDAGEIELSPGQHIIEIDAPDFRPAIRAIQVQAGSTVVMAVSMDPVVATLDIGVEPYGAILEVDGRDYGSRVNGAPLRLGSHDVVARAPGHWRDWFRIDVTPDVTAARHVTLTSAVRWHVARSGIANNLMWLGDLDGDGRMEVGHANFTRFKIFDPWRGTTAHTFALDYIQRVVAEDFDGDGVTDLAARFTGADGSAIEAWNLDLSQGRPIRRWRSAPVQQGSVLAAARRGSGWVVVFTDPEAGTVTALDAASGERAWSTSLDSPPRFVERLESEDPAALIVVTDRTLDVVDASTGARRFSVEHGITLGRFPDYANPRAVMVGTDADPSIAITLPRAPADHTVAIRASDGAPLWSLDVSRSPLAAADFDGDGFRNLASGARIISGRDGAELRAPAGDCRLDGTRAVCLLEGDAVATDLIAQREVARRKLPGGVSLVGVDDVDGDRETEILLSTPDGRLALLDWDLRVFAIADLDATVQLGLKTTDADGDGTPDLLLEADGPMLVTGTRLLWQREALAPRRAGASLADYDGDGELDIAVLGRERSGGGLQLLDAVTGRAKWAADVPGENRTIIRAPVPLCEDDRCDMVFSSSGSVVRYDGRTGEHLGAFNVGEAYATPVVGDVDGDGHPQVVIPTWDQDDTLWIIDGDMAKGRAIGLPDGSFGQALLDDVNGDGRLDAILTLLNGEAVAVTLVGAGKLLWSRPLGGAPIRGPTPVTLDGEVLYAFAGGDDDLVLIDRAGEERWRVPDVVHASMRPAAGDVDGDGMDDVFVAARGGVVRRVSNGRVLWRCDLPRRINEQEISPTTWLVLSDLEGDGAYALISGWDDGTVAVVAASDGALRWLFRAQSRIEAPPLVGDVDGDGLQELFIASNDRFLYGLRARSRSLRTGRTDRELGLPEQAPR